MNSHIVEMIGEISVTRGCFLGSDFGVFCEKAQAESPAHLWAVVTKWESGAFKDVPSNLFLVTLFTEVRLMDNNEII